MNLRAIALTLILAFALLLLLVTLNWTAFAAPSALSLGFTDISAPLGIVMRIFTAAVSGLFVVHIAAVRGRPTSVTAVLMASKDR